MKKTVETNGSRKHQAIDELRVELFTAPAGRKQRLAAKKLMGAITERQEAIKKILAGYDVIREYKEGNRVGIAYNEEGKLVEFAVAEGVLGDMTLTAHEITLANSLEWAEKMLFAEQRLGWCAQCGDTGIARWFTNLQIKMSLAEKAALQ